MSRVAIAYLRPLLEGDAGDGEASAAAQLGLEVVSIVCDEHDDARRLAEALEWIAAGKASVLLARSLGALAGSLRELVGLLDWLEAAGADLVALDVGLDTGTAVGRRIAGVLREVARWDREPRAGRPPRGRPGLAVLAPELAERITVMRAGGLSLQAIADSLNADGVPTRRGGTHWRPSSVQAALGYRRPRPPAPGAPPPPLARHPPGRSPRDAPPRPPGRGGRPHPGSERP